MQPSPNPGAEGGTESRGLRNRRDPDRDPEHVGKHLRPKGALSRPPGEDDLLDLVAHELRVDLDVAQGDICRAFVDSSDAFLLAPPVRVRAIELDEDVRRGPQAI